MNVDILEYQRDRALDWLRQRIKDSEHPEILDHQIDAIICAEAGQTDNDDNAPEDYDVVTWDWLQAKWVDQGNEAGWIRVITAVNGSPTGLPNHL